MSFLANIVVALVAILHAYILILEMFLWTKSKTRKVFGFTKEQAENTVVLAANQGLYNGFLSAGLFWGLLHSDPVFSQQIQIFFLICVVIAAIYGAYSVKKTILYIQGVPALIGLILILMF